MEKFTTYLSSPLGAIRLQCSETHLQAIVFEEKKGQEMDAHPILQRAAKQLEQYFDGKLQTFDLPVLQPGTAFQQKVWDLLYQIPIGKTLSYQELAKRYGDLKAIRAVASANGRNNLAILVPCHRVIGSNRTLTGYAGGLWRKKWLLEHEARHFSGVQTLF